MNYVCIGDRVWDGHKLHRNGDVVAFTEEAMAKNSQKDLWISEAEIEKQRQEALAAQEAVLSSGVSTQEMHERYEGAKAQINDVAEENAQLKAQIEQLKKEKKAESTKAKAKKKAEAPKEDSQEHPSNAEDEDLGDL